jgi:indolepyruvate ferredoxin oxidoreductase, beta subunit
MKDSINFLLAGVGGQGTILASDVLVNVGRGGGLPSQAGRGARYVAAGGSVTSLRALGKGCLFAPCRRRRGRRLPAFEKAEALRNLGQLRQGALTVVNLQAIEPVTVTSGGQAYPDDERIRTAVSQITDKAVYVDGESIATALGNVKAANVVLLGTLSALVEQEGLAPGLTEDAWLAVITERVPAKYLELNRKAFAAGRGTVLAPVR